MSRKQLILPKLIGFCGYATSGKNTAAEELNKILKENEIHTEYKIVGFADSLKGDIKPCIDFCKEYGIDTTTKEFKELFRPMWVLWSRVAKAVTNNKLIWLDRLFRVIESAPDDYIAICDVRYDYEVHEILNRGGVVFFINRPNVSFANEEEKQSFYEIITTMPELFQCNLVDNDSTKKELGLKIFNRLVKHGQN